VDAELRERQRAHEADPGDQAALRAYIDALDRAGRPVTGDLLDRVVRPSTTIDAPIPLRVTCTLPTGEERWLGWTPVDVPPHRSMRIEGRPRGAAELEYPDPLPVVDTPGSENPPLRGTCDEAQEPPTTIAATDAITRVIAVATTIHVVEHQRAGQPASHRTCG
jgi:hypothetical protein